MNDFDSYNKVIIINNMSQIVDEDIFQNVKKRIEASDIDYLDKPYRRFKGTEFEQETFFVEDPNGNVLEIKTMTNPEVLFKVTN